MSSSSTLPHSYITPDMSPAFIRIDNNTAPIGCNKSERDPKLGPKPDAKFMDVINSHVPTQVITVLTEFTFVMFVTLVTCLGYSYYAGLGLALGGPSVAAAVETLAFFTANGISGRYYGNSMLVLLSTLNGFLGLWPAFLLVVAHFGARFAGAGVARLIADSNYVNAGFYTGPGTSTLEGFLAEIAGGIILLMITHAFTKAIRKMGKRRVAKQTETGVVLKKDNTIKYAVYAMMILVTVFATQACFHPISSAAFDPIRWLAVSAVGASGTYFPGYFWIYLVAPIIVVVAHYAVRQALCWIKHKVSSEDRKLKTRDD